MPLFLSACASFEPPYVTKGYEEAAEIDVAIIKGSGFIDIVKHKDMETGTYADIFNHACKPMPAEFRLAPGNYCVFYSSYSYITGSPMGMGCFDLKAGHKYRVDTYIKTHHYSRIWFEDMTTDEIISDVGWTGPKDWRCPGYAPQPDSACRKMKETCDRWAWSKRMIEIQMEKYIKH